MSKRDLISEYSQDVATDNRKRRKTDLDDGQTLMADIPKFTANDAYTVGWICAISTEYVAVQAFLDEEHDRPEYVSPNDSNDYTLGKIGKHNVVIAVLPGGEYGIASAAIVAKDMLHSFPNVRIGLMVGIGGGAPSQKHDIRLGDIVVSEPRDGMGGVFQYDFGKTIQGQNFYTTGFLNQPPTVLRTAVNGIKAQYKRKGHKLEEAINKVLDDNPRLRQECKRPGSGSDRLYQSGVVHPPNYDSACVEHCGIDPLHLVLRSERTKEEDNPAIHYGVIASANQLMKSALVRDALVAAKNVITGGITGKEVLCFEMEAAGLMNQFPCLVIRGICDYSDSHKNKTWQGYAAMAAAAYAKDLLCRIPPIKVEAEKKIVDILSDVGEKVIGVARGVNNLLYEKRIQDHKTILNWLTPIDYAPQQTNYIGRRQPGTGQWLLDSAEYQAWLETNKQTLFCPGIPGAGKTIITAIVIDNLYTRFQCDASVGIAYLYCDFRRQQEQKTEDLLANVLKQLAQKQVSIPDSIQDLYDQYKDKPKRPSLDEISRVLHSISTLYSKIFIVLDALDECQVTDECRTRLLSEIFKLQERERANIFSTSRPIPEIQEIFKASVSLEIRARDEDVQTYLAGHMTHLPSFVLSSPDLQNAIIATISKAVDGMFLLVPLHMDSLAREPTVGHIERALQNLPIELDETYKQAMIRIESQGGGFRELAKKVLYWVIHARRVLSTAELQHALAVEPRTLKLNRKFIPNIEIIGSICAGLVIVDTQSNVVRLVHYTTQEYFDRAQDNWFPNAEINIATVCVTYLSFDEFESGICQNDKEFEERLQTSRLYDYVSHNWGHHARKASTLIPEVISFLERKVQVEASSQALLAVKQWPWQVGYSQDFPKQMTGLHLSAYFGVEPVVKLLLDKGADIAAADDYCSRRAPILI
ncbi:hypothetical protein G7Y89_g4500 [Cudoniella acicularis]|uniref:Nucleoside phosphorylase domain-containing protein n=1 Tax=Cudoniella acicularis TaxID=354080 RepID=A0A8H4W4M6_9HELO|nr:hypothetical protein G7Y89_g4500 [Cudoniella acicularis]